jgi:transposase
MNQALPIIHETAEELRTLMKAEARPKAQQRLHALYLVASAQARSRSAVARLLGVNRETIGAWLALYRRGGLALLLDLYTPPGRTSAVPPPVLTQLRERLQQPDGFASYGDIQRWLADHGVQMQYKAVQKLVAYKLLARPKVARPRHIKKGGGGSHVPGDGGGTDPRGRAARLPLAGRSALSG